MLPCNYPGCTNDAIFRFELDNLKDNRRLVGFDMVSGKVQLVYHCRVHFEELIRDYVRLWDKRDGKVNASL